MSYIKRVLFKKKPLYKKFDPSYVFNGQITFGVISNAYPVFSTSSKTKFDAKSASFIDDDYTNKHSDCTNILDIAYTS